MTQDEFLRFLNGPLAALLAGECSYGMFVELARHEFPELRDQVHYQTLYPVLFNIRGQDANPPDDPDSGGCWDVWSAGRDYLTHYQQQRAEAARCALTAPRHAAALAAANRCGCFHCLHVMNAADVIWPEEEAGVCPHCLAQAVVASPPGWELDSNLLMEIRRLWSSEPQPAFLHAHLLGTCRRTEPAAELYQIKAVGARLGGGNWQMVIHFVERDAEAWRTLWQILQDQPV